MKYTNMNAIEVPEYVANDFNQPLGHPSEKEGAVELSLNRVYKLISETLKEIKWPDWEVDNRRYHSPNDNEPYCFQRVDDKFYIYTEERGQKKAIAIFKNDHIAAKYFVWLVSSASSEGEKKINWDLFVEMEP